MPAYSELFLLPYTHFFSGTDVFSILGLSVLSLILLNKQQFSTRRLYVVARNTYLLLVVYSFLIF
jgi:hypothetical protein